MLDAKYKDWPESLKRALVGQLKASGCGANQEGGGGFQRGNSCASGGDAIATLVEEPFDAFERLSKEAGLAGIEIDYGAIWEDAPDGDEGTEHALAKLREAIEADIAKVEEWRAIQADVTDSFSKSIDLHSDSISRDTRESFKASFREVLGQMNTKALKVIHERTELKMFASKESLQKRYAQMRGMSLSEVNVGGAAVHRSNGQVVLMLNGGGGGLDQTGIYAHELAHVLDPFGEISNTTAWNKAWELEIRKGGLSEYAKSEPIEGFAEFGRLLWTRPAYVQDDFPQCYKVWKDAGLVQ